MNEIARINPSKRVQTGGMVLTDLVLLVFNA